MTPEQITVLATRRAPISEHERALIPEATARWRTSHRFRLVYLHLATQQSWWHGSAAQISEMRRLAQEKFPDRAPGGASLMNVPAPASHPDCDACNARRDGAQHPTN